MLNYETILSSYDDKMTLMQWLKKVEQALQGASATAFRINKKGNATIAFVLDFADGTSLESGYITLQKGESISNAYLENGHLIIEMTNGEIIDAGNIKPVSHFAFDNERHLIVTYQDGTTQDLGLIKGIDQLRFTQYRRLVVEYDDGTSQDLGLVKGVSSFTIDANQHLIVNYDNGTTEDLGSLGDYSNVDFEAKTLKQTLANYKIDFTLGLGSVFSGKATLSQIFNRFQVINNRLSIVVNYKLSIGSNDVIVNPNSFLNEANLQIDEQYGSAIFDYDGNSVSSAIGSVTKITTTQALINAGKTYNASLLKGAYMSLYNNTSANQMFVSIESKEQITFTANTDYYVTARILLDLL